MRVRPSDEEVESMIAQCALEVLDHFENPSCFPLEPPLRMALALRDLQVHRGRKAADEQSQKSKDMATNEPLETLARQLAEAAFPGPSITTSGKHTPESIESQPAAAQKIRDMQVRVAALAMLPILRERETRGTNDTR